MRKCSLIHKIQMRLRALVTTLLLLLSCQLILARPVPAVGVQPMGLLQGSEVNFASGASQLLPAFCLDKARAQPASGSSFDNYRGNIKLTFTDGETKTYDLAEPQQRTDAFSHFRMEGTGYYKALRFSKIDPTLLKVEFLSTGLAHTGGQTDLEQVLKYLETFADLTANLPRPKSATTLRETYVGSYIAAQQRIWANPHVIERVAGKSVTFDSIRRDQKRTAIQQIINLEGRGDAILVQYADVNLLIDTGLSTEGFARIASKLPKNIRLDILLTHRDQDHIGNLRRLIQASAVAGIAIDNIMISTFEVPSFEKMGESTKIVEGLLKELKDRNYQRSDLKSPVAIFNRTGSAPLLSNTQENVGKLLQEAKEDLAADGAMAKLLEPEERAWLAGVDPMPIEAYDLVLSPDLKLSVFQKKAPKTPNESSLVTKMVHNGRSTLYTGDINERVMEDLLAFSNPQSRATEIASLQFVLSYLKSKRPTEYSRFAATMARKSPSDELNALDEIVESVLAEDPTFRSRFDNLFTSGGFGLLRADVLKWPHHAWLPRSSKGKEILKRFIETVDPQTIVFSISPEISEMKLSATEFVNAESFVMRLKTGTDPLSVWLLAGLSEPNRRLVANYDANGVTQEFKQALALELTRLIQGPLIYSKDRFAGIDLGELQARLASGIPEAERPVVNRELLELAYSAEIGAIRGQNVEKVKAFLREAFPDRQFNFVMTPEGDIRFLTRNIRASLSSVASSRVCR